MERYSMFIETMKSHIISQEDERDKYKKWNPKKVTSNLDKWVNKKHKKMS